MHMPMSVLSEIEVQTCVCLTDALEVVEVLLGLGELFQVVIVVADIHPSILHDLLSRKITGRG